MGPGQQQEDEDGCQLDEDEDAVELRALLGAADQEEGKQQRDQDGGDVDDAAVSRYMGQRMADFDAGALQETGDIA